MSWDTAGASVLFAVYHFCWSWMRGAYALLFGCYWAKRFQGGGEGGGSAAAAAAATLGQAFVCGWGVLYFGLASPLAMTGETAWLGSCLRTSAVTTLGEYAHGAEATGLYMSMCLFALNGAFTGAWRGNGGGALEGRLFTGAVVVGMGGFFANALLVIVQNTTIGGSWFWRQYCAGYTLIIAANLYVLARLPRYLLLLSVAEDPGPLRTTAASSGQNAMFPVQRKPSTDVAASTTSSGTAVTRRTMLAEPEPHDLHASL